MTAAKGLRAGKSCDGATREPEGAQAHRGRRSALLGLAATLVLGASPALAVVDVNKSFVPINVVPGQTSTMTISLFNSATAIAGGAAFVDALPANVNATSIVSNGCGGTLSIVPATQVSLAAGAIPAGDGINSGRCDVVVSVRSTIPGTYVNTIPAGGVTTTDQGSNPQAASATLTVSPFLPLTGTKAFSPNVLHVDPAGVSTVTITLTNPNTQLPLTNLSFTDNLPVPLEVSSPVTTGGTCGGAFTDGSGGTLDPTDTSFRITGGSLAANGSCTVTVQVRVRASEANVARNGGVTNTIGSGTVTTAEGVTTTASISGSVTVQTGARVDKAFSPSTVTVGGTSTLTLTLRNYNLAAISPADLVDAMPAGITVVGPVTTTCGGTTSFTATQVQLTGGTIPAAASATTNNNGSCTVTATVQGTTIGSWNNTIPTGNFGSVAYSTGNATLVVNPAATSVSAAKAFSPTTVVQSQQTTLTITLSNSGGLNAAITSFTDNLTTMGTGFTVAASPAATTTCGGSLGAVPGGTAITLSGGTIPAGGNCTITVPVAVAPNASTGTRTNTIAAGALVTDQGSNAFAAAANLTVSQAATVAKSWNPTTVLSGGISRLTITISHANGAIAFTNMGLTDLLTSMGTGFVVAATPNVFNNCGGTVTAAAGTTSIVLVGGSLGTGATSCQIRVDVQTPPGGAPGSYQNRIVANNLSTAEGFTYNANANASLTLQAAPPVTLNKAFTPVVSNGGAPSVVSITIANNRAGAIALTNVGLVDLLPANVEVYSVPAATFTGAGCSGATISAVPFATQIGFAGASINANSTCTLSVNVTAFVDGNHVNQIPISTLTSAQGVTNDNEPSATLTILRNVNVAKSFSPNTVEVGGSSTLTIRISNTNTVPRTLADPGLVDTLPLGVTVAAAPAPSTTCPGATVDAPAGGGTVTVRNGSLAASTSCTVTVPVTVGATGTYVNTIPANSLVTLEGSTNPDPATDTLRAVAKPTITKAFSPASIPAGGTSTITFTLSNPNNGTLLPGGLTGASFTDTLAGMAIHANQNAAGSCAGAATNAFVTGQTALSFSGLTIPAGSPGTCTVTVVVAAPVPGIFPNVTSGVLTGQTQTPGSPSPSVDLTVLAGPPTIAKSFSPATILGGGTSVLTFVLSNPNAVAAALATPAFTDVFPTSPGAMTLASTTVSNTCGGTVVDSGGGALNVGDVGIRLNGGSIPAGGSCTLAVTVTAGVPGVYANTSSLLASTNAGTSLAPASDSLTVSAQADLSLLKTISNPTPFVGSTVTFTVTLANAGPAPADGVTVTDPLPIGYTFVSASPSQGTYDALSGLWTIGTVGVGASPTLAVQATVNLSGPYGTNIAEVMTSSLPDPDSTPGNGNPAEDDYASAAAAPIPAADLSITKTDGVTTVIPGNTVTYTIVATNAGPSAVTGATVADTFPATLTGVTWTCVATGGGSCTASGSGNIADTVNLPVGATATYTVTATVSATATGTLVNTATVTLPGGITDPTPGNNSATDTDTVAPRADLRISKSGPGSATPGSTLTYTLVVANDGPADATGVSVTDPPPAGLTFVSASAPCAGGFPCSVGDLAAGSTVSLTVTFAVPSGYTAPDPIVNIASVAGDQPDPTPANNTASSSTAVGRTPSADIGVVKTGPATAAPGSTVTYSLVVTNHGPDDAANVSLADPVPAGLAFASATAPCAGGFPCSLGTLNAGASVSVSATFSIPAGYTTPDPIVNAASVSTTTSDPNPANDASTAPTALGASPVDLSVVKSGPATVSVGSDVTFSFLVRNAGPSAATLVQLADPTPAGLAFVSASAPCAGGFPCLLGTLPAGASTAVTATFSVPAGYSGPNPIANTATVSSPEPDADPANDSSTATVGVGAEAADVAVAKTGPASAVAGQSVTWQVTVSNLGPGTAQGVSLADPTPAGLVFASATAPCAGGFPCALGELAAGSSVTVAATFSIPGGYTSPDPILNTATVTSTTPDGNPANDSATASTGLSRVADLAVVKSNGTATYVPGIPATWTITVTNNGPSAVSSLTLVDALPPVLSSPAFAPSAGSYDSATGAWTGLSLAAGQSVTLTVSGTVSASATGPLVNTATVAPPVGVTDPNPTNDVSTDTDTADPQADLSITKTDGVTTVIPGNNVTYTIVARNAGPSAVSGATVSDTFPATLTGVTWTCLAAGGGSCTATGIGDINDIVDLPVGATATYTVNATVSVSAAGALVNTATVTLPGGITDPTPGNNTATDTDALEPTADLSVTKTDGAATYTPGGTVVYTIVVASSGPSAVTGATVSDPLPSGITTASWSCSASPGSTCASSGTGAIADTVNLLSGGTLTYTLTLTIPPGRTGDLVNTVTVTPPVGVTDPTPGNDTATDTDTSAPSADLIVTKTASSASVLAGSSLEFRVVVRNQGPSTATNVVLTDPLPAGLLFVGATTSQGSCSGTTTIACALGAIAPQSQAEIVLTVRALSAGSFVNSATATLNEPDPTPPNNVSTAPFDVQGQAAIPAASETGLLALALLVAAAGMLVIRRAVTAV